MTALLHEETLRKLTFPLWKKIFEDTIKLNENPFFQKWYQAKYAELSEHQEADELNPDYRWIRIVALLSIVRDGFNNLDLPIPSQWQSFPHPYTAKTFDLGDLDESQFPKYRVHKWCSFFDSYEDGKKEWLKEGNTSEPWWFREKLLDGFEQRKPESKKRGRHTNRAGIIKSVGNQKERIKRVAV